MSYITEIYIKYKIQLFQIKLKKKNLSMTGKMVQQVRVLAIKPKPKIDPQNPHRRREPTLANFIHTHTHTQLKYSFKKMQFIFLRLWGLNAASCILGQH